MKNREELSVMADIAKNSVSTVEVAKALGLDVGRHNRCPCPFHNGQDRNMSLKGNFFHCFVCGAKGDIFHLIQGVMGIPFIDALKWVNEEFGLRMNIDSPMDETTLKTAKKRQKQREAKRAYQEWLQRSDFDMYLTAGEVLMRLEQMRDDNQPRYTNEPWNKVFCYAIETIPIIKSLADDMAIYAIGVNHE